MLNIVSKSENYIVDYPVTDSSGDPVLFANMNDVVVKVKDYAGTDVNKTKAGGDITEGSTTSSILFELTVSDLKKLSTGLIKIYINTKLVDADYAGGFSYKEIIDELFILE